MSSTTDVFKDTFAYLEQNISEDFYCEDFDKSRAKALYDHLFKKYSKHQLKENRSEIRRAIKSYFSLLNQRISIFFQGFHTIIIKDLQKQIFGQYSKQFHNVSKCVHSVNDELEDFETTEGIYMIHRRHLNELGCDFENIEDRALKREMYKQAIKDGLDLGPRDLVFFMNDKITIKKFIQPTEQNFAERRAGGLPPEELERLKNIVFEKNIYDEINKAISNLMDTKLDFTVISNEYFRKNVIAFVQDELYKVTSIYMDEDSDVALKKAFVNYIFREHFKNIHKIFAKHILELHTTRDKNVEMFLKYYDGNIEIINDKQIQKPEIIDENDQKWNAVSMLPIVIQKKKNDREIEMIEEYNDKAQNKITQLQSRIETIQDENAKLEEKKESINNRIKDIITESRQLQEENSALKKKIKKAPKDEKEELQSKLNKIVVQIKKLGKDEDLYRINIRDLNNKIETNNIKTTNINVDVSAQEKLMKDNQIKKQNLLELHKPVEEKYELIVDALAKTLMKKY